METLCGIQGTKVSSIPFEKCDFGPAITYYGWKAIDIVDEDELTIKYVDITNPNNDNIKFIIEYSIPLFDIITDGEYIWEAQAMPKEYIQHVWQGTNIFTLNYSETLKLSETIDLARHMSTKRIYELIRNSIK